jgi:hypothetical protein
MRILSNVAIVLLLTCGQSLGQTSPDRLDMESQRVRMAFTAAAHGGVASLVDKATGRELIASPVRDPLFQLEFSESQASDAARFTLMNWDAAVVQFRGGESSSKKSDGQIVLSQFKGRPIEVRCSFQATASEPLVRCRIQVSFPEPLVLEKVQFPMLTLCAKPADKADDAIVLGSSDGGVYRRPSAYKAGWEHEISATQPPSLAAQFGCWYDGQVGLLTAALDTRGYHKTIAFRRHEAGILASWTLPMFESKVYTQTFDFVLKTSFDKTIPQV